MYGLALQDLRHRGSLLGSSRQHIAGGALGYASLGEPHRWGSSRTRRAGGACTEAPGWAR